MFELLSCSLQPLNCFVFQRIVYTKGHAGGPAAAAPNAVIRFNED
jgi:hypothetical protein